MRFEKTKPIFRKGKIAQTLIRKEIMTNNRPVEPKKTKPIKANFEIPHTLQNSGQIPAIVAGSGDSIGRIHQRPDRAIPGFVCAGIECRLRALQYRALRSWT